METPIHSHRKDIDGLRAIAVLAVVIYHAFPAWLPGGYFGVDVFFVISGFLITRIILSELAANRFSFAGFYARRIKRIYPALLLIVGTCLGLGWFLLLADEFEELSKNALFGLTFSQNLHLMRGSGYFAPAGELNPLLHLWSLAVEEQFYIFFPGAVVLCARLGFSPKKFMATGAILSLLCYLYLYEHYPTTTFYGLHTRVWELLLGGLLSQLAGPSSRALSLVGLGCIIGSFLIHPEVNLFPELVVFLPTIGAALVLVSKEHYPAMRLVLTGPPVVVVGLLSYSLYLWHWPLIVIGKIIEGKDFNSGMALGVLALSALLAGLCYRTVEDPLRRTQRPWALPLIALTTCLVLAASVHIYLGKGLPQRHPALSAMKNGITNRAWASQGHLMDGPCVALVRGKIAPLDFCKLRFPGVAPTVAIIGDSTSNHFYPGLAELFARRRENLLNLGQASCPVFRGVETYLEDSRIDCAAVMGPALDFVLRTPSIRTVILSMSGQTYLSGRASLVQNVRLRMEGKEHSGVSETFERELRETLSLASRSGKEVVYVLGVPRLDFNPVLCLKRRPWKLSANSNSDNCNIPTATFAADQAEYLSLVRRILSDFPTVRIWDAAKSLCDQRACRAMLDGKILYRDDVHLNLEGSAFVTRSFEL